MTKRILHLTDLHISDPDCLEENLRRNRFKEYIDELYDDFFNSSCVGSLDLLFITGDFVDRGSVSNFDYVSNVVDYIIEKFGVKEGRTFFCLGNHDIVREEERNGNAAAAIADYKKFVDKYSKARGADLLSEDRASVYQVGSDYVLVFDAVSNTGGTDRPVSSLNANFIDTVASELIREKISGEADLFILSHYPVVQSKKYLLDYEEGDWTGRHIWKSGYPLKERISKIRGRLDGKTIWFFGDAHIPDLYQEEERPAVLYTMTGQFGGKYSTVSPQSAVYHKYHQATVLELDETEVRQTIFSFAPEGFTYNPHLGKWSHACTTVSLPPAVSTPSNPEPIPFVVVTGPAIEVEIYNEILRENLYKFGKFITSAKNVSLGWVSINNLFANTLLFSNGVDSVVSYLKRNIPLNTGLEMFIGCGFWGGILASNVAVRTSVESHVISSFVSDADNCTYEESLEYLIKSLNVLEKKKRIVVFTDVVSSGDTLLAIKNRVEKSTNKAYEWFAVTIIVDENNLSPEFKSSFKICAALCTKLKMPVIMRSLLPDDDIYPPRLDLTIK